MNTTTAILLICLGSLRSLAQTPSTPQVFLPGIVSTRYNERDLAISADDNEVYYTIQHPRASVSVIVRRVRKGNEWSEAEAAVFSGQYSDLEPAFSSDGKKLFFVSNRPLTPEGKTKDYDIWYVEKTSKGWSQPINAGNQVNSSGDEYYPSLTSDGSVYFTAERPDAVGKGDLYKSTWKQDHFEAPVNIGPGVNSALDEFNAFVDPQEKYIIFGAEGGEGDVGYGDLYISYRNNDGSWTKAKNLGAPINSKRLDYCPLVHKGIFYFTSERPAPKTVTKQQTLKELKATLDSYGNGLGDILYVPIDQVVH